ncbi:hypothetical protein HDU77_001706 [Chytriomyces hyalinus]|nr:hypothetical protein HDU77_001706 [Chytriomyces hyalinus]
MTNQDLDTHSFSIDTPPYTPSNSTESTQSMQHQHQYTHETHSAHAVFYTPPPLLLSHSFSLPSSQPLPHPLPAPAQIRNSHRVRQPITPSVSPTTTRMCKIDSRASRVVLVSNLPDSVDDRDVRAFLSVMPFGIAALNHVRSTRSAYIELTSADQVLPFISTFNGAPFVDRFISCTVKKPFNSNPQQTPQGLAYQRRQYPHQVSPIPVQTVPVPIVNNLPMMDYVEIAKDSYFVMKAYHLLDIESSQRNASWCYSSFASEQALVSAFSRCENVYLAIHVAGSRGFSGVAAMRGVMCAPPAGVVGNGMHDVRGGLVGVKMFPVEWIISGFVPFEQVDHLLPGKTVKSRRKSFGKFGDTTEIPPDVGFALCQILSHAN